MSLGRRLFLSKGGGGSGSTPPGDGLTPPTDDSWVRDPSNPIISADEGWDGNWVLEPTVLYEGGMFRMIYTGNNNTANVQQLGYAESSDGVTWTKHGSPIFGNGVVETHGVTQPEVHKVGSTYYLYYRSSAEFFCVATSSDMLTWTVLDTDIITNPDGQTEWDNSTIVIESGTWHMVIEGMTSGVFVLYYWTSTDGVSWTPGNGGARLSDLEVASGGMYGGPFLWPEPIDGLWHLWYHACPSAGLLPTNIYHATSPDFTTWTKTSPSPILSFGVDPYEVDQVADPCLLVVDGTAYMFFDGDQNGPYTGAIGVATAPAV